MARKRSVAVRVLSLWQRVILQRPGIRKFLWNFVIKWRVCVCQKRIAVQKAQDLLAIWNALHAKRYIRGWAGVYQISRYARTTRLWRCLGPWWGHVQTELLWQKLRKM